MKRRPIHQSEVERGAMRCATCGMEVKGKPIREQIEGHVYYYCCRDCFEEELCRRDKPLRRAFGARSRKALGSKPRHHHSGSPEPRGRSDLRNRP